MVFSRHSPTDVSTNSSRLEGAPPQGASEPRSPLSKGQRALWFLDRLAPGSSAYVLAGALRVKGPLDVPALRDAFDVVAARHPTLRSFFSAGGRTENEPVQRVLAQRSPTFVEEDAVGWDEATVEARQSELAWSPFDLARDPLLRVGVLHRGPDEHRVVVALHHIVADFWSLGVLLGELSVLYGGAGASGETGPAPELLPPLRSTYAEHVRRQEFRLAGPDGDRLWEFWRRELQGRRLILDLPTDRPRLKLQTFRGDVRSCRLDAGLTDGVQALGRERRTTLFVILLAAFQALLYRYTGETEMVVGSPTVGRSSASVAGLIGYFVNPVVLRGDMAGDPVFTEFLGRVRQTVLAALAHRAFPFPLLTERLAPERDLSRSPVFQVMLSFEQERGGRQQGLAALAVGESGVPVALGGLAVETLHLPPNGSQIDLTLFAAVVQERLVLSLQFNPDLFDSATIERLCGHLRSLLAGIAAAPASRLEQLPLLATAERHQLLIEGNDTAAAYAPLLIHERFAEVAESRPDTVALATENAALTYGELDRRSNRLAHCLRRLGTGAESSVGICLERSLEMVLAVLAVIKAGGAYLPLDPTHPAERLAFQLADGAVSVVVTEERWRDRLPDPIPGGVRLLCLDRDRAGIAAEPITAVASRTLSESLACVMYTSGSTGRPKGVGIPHRGVMRLVLGAEFTSFGPDEVFLQLAPLAFDASTLEIWGALLHGSRLVVSPPGLPSLAELRGVLERQGVSFAWLTAGLFHQVVETDLSALQGLRHVMSGGDVLSPSHVARAVRGLPGMRLTNGYGPTESATFTTCFEVENPLAPGVSIPIGRPIANTAVYLLDAWLEPVPQGAAGELCVGGDGLARGYLKRPALSAERFVPSPVGRGERLYRTGDLARRSSDGNLQFLGRTDDQIKIRGFRVEPGETEAALARHPEVAAAAVVVREDGFGERRLVAYVVPREGASPPLEELRVFLKSRLLEAQVPSSWVLLDSLPLNANAKVDRRHLPAPDWGAVTTAYVAPRTATEERIAEIWGNVLGRERVGVEDDFFFLGGHSLLATQLLSRLQASLGVELTLRQLFERPTVSGLAALAEAAISVEGAATGQAPPLVRASADEERVLSFSQERLWFLDQLEPGQATYNVAAAVALRGTLGAAALAALAASLGEIVRRHETLRTRFVLAAGQPRPVVEEPATAVLPVVDLEALPGGLGERLSGSLAGEEARRPFDLARGPVVRATLLRLARDEHRLLFTLHHIACDGWSLGVLVSELSALYGAFSRRQPSPLPELPLQYSDYALWQRRWLTESVLEAQLSYWRQRLAGAPQLLTLPTDRPRPVVRSGQGGAVEVMVPATLRAGLGELAGGRRATLFMALLAGFHVLLSRYSGQRDLLVGSPVANRTRVETEGLIGFFVNTLVLRGEIAPEASFAGFLTQVRTSALEAYAHQDLPFERLVLDLVSERSGGVPPLVQVLLAVEGRPRGEAALPTMPGLTLDVLRPETGTAKLDLSLDLRESGGELVGRLEYSRELFDGATIERLYGHFLVLLAVAASKPEVCLWELPLLTEVERQELLAWNATAVSYPAAGACLHELIAAQAARTPDSTAVVFEDTALSYGDLAFRARLLAGRLRDLGVRPEVPVGICLERSLELVMGLVAILSAGGAYVPLDPSYPPERLARMLEDALPPVVLVQESTAALLPAHPGREVVVCDTGEAGDTRGLGLRAGGGEVGIGARSENLAYVIFTSGSTGRPKGAMNSHRAIVNRLLWAGVNHGVTQADRILQKTPVSFDVSVWELFLPLLSGACLVVARPGGHQDPAYLARALARHEITVAHFVPAMLHAFLAEPWIERATALRQVVASGEALSPALQERFFSRLPAVGLLNLYGPTEAAVDVTSWRCVPGAPEVPIGLPVANTWIRLLDCDRQPVPVGVAGELHIGGIQVARGYLGRPDLTAERFVPDASGEPGSRLYRTGDLARRSSDGNLQFLGRTDDQIKIRGFRVEPGETEAALARHPEVAAAVVVVREDGFGERRLVAYVVPREGASPPLEELRVFLKSRLLEAQVPSSWVLLDSLPLNANAKVDRRHLPAPDWGAVTTAYVAPRTATEERIAEIWGNVLGRERVGVEDDFFFLGGHSLLATQLLSRLQASLGVELTLRQLFERPTVSGLAALAEAAISVEGAATGQAPPLVRASADEERVLSFSQERLWFLDQLEPGQATYNVAAAVALRGTLGAAALAALAASLGEIVRRHETLRTRFVLAAGQPRPVVEEPATAVLPVVDLEALPGGLGERLSGSLAGEEARRPFDLARGPVVRATLLRLARDEHRLLFTLHHIACDGWSLGVLVSELSALYGAFSRRQPSPLPELPLQYSDYALWQRRWLTESVLEAQLSYWRQRLAGAPQLLTLPTDRPRPVVRSGQGGAVEVMAPATLRAGLGELAGGRRATLFMALLAGFHVLLSRYSGQRDLLVGSPVANRTRVETEGLIGFFVNTLVLRGEIAPEASFAGFLTQVRTSALEAYAHQDLPFERLVLDLVSERSGGVPPLVQVLLAVEGRPRGEATLPTMPGLTLDVSRPETGTARFDLSLDLRELNGELVGRLEYRRDLFDSSTIERLGGHFLTLLTGAVVAPSARVLELPLLTRPERQELLGWNATAVSYPAADRCLHELIAAQVARTPDTTAVVFENTALSYFELAARAGLLAGQLRRSGVGPEVPVGICLDRSLELVIGLVAILTAGGAYVPLDPTYPAERLAWMLEDALPPAVLVEERTAALLPAHPGRQLVLGAGGTAGASPSLECGIGSDAGIVAGPESLAYVIFTSGSTGRPKGVMNRHRGIVNQLLWLQSHHRLTAVDRMFQKTPVSFDMSVLELFWPLLAGACLVMARPGGHRDSAYLVASLAEREITVTSFVPSMLQVFLEEPDVERATALCQVAMIGEALLPSLQERFFDRLPRAGLLNLYGPTEAAVDVTFWQCVPGSPNLPIGRPVANTAIHLLDRDGQPVPVGAHGELHIGGVQVARGYLGRPDLTAERFVPDGLGEAGSRLYRTGDLARRLAGGELEYLGRIDTQVKLRGFRIELAEIEAILVAHPEWPSMPLCWCARTLPGTPGWWPMWCRRESPRRWPWSCARSCAISCPSI